MKISPSLFSKNLRQIKNNPPEVVILPWGATETHGQHLPYASDVIQSYEISILATKKANDSGGKCVVLPAIPFGNDAQQLDSFCTIHLNSITAFHILDDVCASLKKQNMSKLLLVNSHGGNNFKPFIRDLQLKHEILILLVDLHLMIPEKVKEIFSDYGDHSGEIETSLMMYLKPETVDKNFGDGKRVPFAKSSFTQSGVWTPRPWKESHPDFGAGNPINSSKEKGGLYCNLLIDRLSQIIVEFTEIKKGEIPFV